MSVTIIARLKAKQGSEAALQEAFQDMIKKVRAAEPGCQAYVLHKSNDDRDPVRLVRGLLRPGGSGYAYEDPAYEGDGRPD